MAANYLHGVETVEVSVGARPIRVIRAGVIGIIGTDPVADRNEPILITSPREAAEKLAPAMAEYTLRKHVDLIFKQNPQATIIAINVYRGADHTANVTNEVCTITNGKFRLATQLAWNYAPVVKSFDLNTTYVPNDDYRFDIHGNFIVKHPDLLDTDGIQVKVTYRRHSLSLVPEADVIGLIDEDGERTGLAVFGIAQTMLGFGPKILLAPYFCETQTFVDELITLADTLRARALVDVVASSVTEAITARGPLGNSNAGTGSRRIGLCWPHRQIPASYHIAGKEYVGLSTLVAGAWSKNISTKDIHYGPSNVELVGSGDPDVIITGSINDSTSDANRLNEVGIITHLNMYGSAPRTWGNRSAAWPNSTTVDNFLAVLLVADVIDESIEQAMLPYIDQPLTNALIESIRENVNAFLNTLIGRGVSLPGAECIYDPSDNPEQELALGHLTFQNSYLPPTPAERITFKRYLATELLNNLGQTS